MKLISTLGAIFFSLIGTCALSFALIVMKQKDEVIMIVSLTYAAVSYFYLLTRMEIENLKIRINKRTK